MCVRVCAASDARRVCARVWRRSLARRAVEGRWWAHGSLCLPLERSFIRIELSRSNLHAYTCPLAHTRSFTRAVVLEPADFVSHPLAHSLTLTPTPPHPRLHYPLLTHAHHRGAFDSPRGLPPLSHAPKVVRIARLHGLVTRLRAVVAWRRCARLRVVGGDDQHCRQRRRAVLAAVGLVAIVGASRGPLVRRSTRPRQRNLARRRALVHRVRRDGRVLHRTQFDGFGRLPQP
mmetsp:Transcript_28597/g.62573  ORF Transcript_28597/g.62573 Transcript_28597/m.62573 type:complete len:232 (+) Transcript_28597:321-1016(+)